MSENQGRRDEITDLRAALRRGEPGAMDRLLPLVYDDLRRRARRELGRAGRLCDLVELRFFGGLSTTETAQVLEVSERTVKRDWTKARTLLHQLLDEGR